MLSDDLNALAITFGRYCVQGGRMFTAEAARALHYVLADLADQAAALERQVAGVSSPSGQNGPGPLVTRNDDDPAERLADEWRRRLRISEALIAAARAWCICEGECYETRHGDLHGPCEAPEDETGRIISAFVDALQAAGDKAAAPEEAAALERQVAGMSSPSGQNGPGPLVTRNDGGPAERWAGDGRRRLRVIDGGRGMMDAADEDRMRAAVRAAARAWCICEGECYETRHGDLHGPCEAREKETARIIAACLRALQAAGDGGAA